MSVTIRSTVETALSNAGVPTTGYTSYINTVVAALEEREFGITETIVEGVASQFSVDAETVTEAVKARTNLEFRPIPEPVVDIEVDEVIEEEEEVSAECATKSGGKAKRIAALEEKVGGLVAAVEALTALAKRHLG